MSAQNCIDVLSNFDPSKRKYIVEAMVVEEENANVVFVSSEHVAPDDPYWRCIVRTIDNVVVLVESGGGGAAPRQEILASEYTDFEISADNKVSRRATFKIGADSVVVVSSD